MGHFYITYDYGYGERGVMDRDLTEDDTIIHFNELLGFDDLQYTTLQQCEAANHAIYKVRRGNPGPNDTGNFMDS